MLVELISYWLIDSIGGLGLVELLVKILAWADSRACAGRARRSRPLDPPARLTFRRLGAWPFDCLIVDRFDSEYIFIYSSNDLPKYEKDKYARVNVNVTIEDGK